MSVLGRIIESKRAELPQLRRKRWSTDHRPRAFSLNASGAVSLITEIKFRSPSAGPLSSVLSLEDRARAYELGGASMISVLCDTPFFGGAYEHLARARAATSLPLLCKEFVVDECQLDAARACGADAVLLIVRCLADAELGRLIEAAHARELTPLVEVFSPEESTRALAAGAAVVGVNARDLDTLQMYPEQASRVLAALPAGVTRLHLSGVKTPEDVQKLAQPGGPDGALIGEVLMRSDNPGPLVASLVQAGRRPANTA